ncbi:hypothetical protein CsatB_019168 [Cannabis sativa]
MNFRSWIAGGIPGLVPVLVWELFRFRVWQWELHAYILLVGLHSGLIPFLIYFYFRETGERASFREDRFRHGGTSLCFFLCLSVLSFNLFDQARTQEFFTNI